MPSRKFIEDNSHDGEALWQEVDAALREGRQVWLRSPLVEPLAKAAGEEQDGRRWLLLGPGMPRAGGWPEQALRWRDLLMSVLALLILLPLLALVALLVRLDSPGPVFFSTAVVGKNRSPFTWRKYRSMTVVPEAADVEVRRARFQAYVEGRHQAGSAAPTKVIDKGRVTRVGRFIRRYSIDELPQLWNVLRGEMSFVGPRPCLPYEAEFYTGWRGRRFDVKPGLSGVWQVYGRGRVGFDESVAMDVYYTYRRSFGFDLALILKTFGIVLTGRGAL